MNKKIAIAYVKQISSAINFNHTLKKKSLPAAYIVSNIETLKKIIIKAIYIKKSLFKYFVSICFFFLNIYIYIDENQCKLIVLRFQSSRHLFNVYIFKVKKTVSKHFFSLRPPHNTAIYCIIYHTD